MDAQEALSNASKALEALAVVRSRLSRKANGALDSLLALELSVLSAQSLMALGGYAAAVQKLESARELMQRFQDTDAALEAHYNLGLCHSAPWKEIFFDMS